ncbi:JmjC domain protein [Aspergillus arachidicola]|uniref:JmjC domain protein n=1 Tax=Aspergillus arachidicola TaxID=656916 RepID=A0A2G7FJH3_9EURO|nr:JmjC domain protein [Aspergillus arachidicola]
MKIQRWLFNGNPRAWYRPPSAVARFNNPNRRHAQSSTQNISSVATTCGYHPLKILDDASIENFRKEHFIPELPIVLPRHHFRDLPAFGRWFQSSPSEPNASRLNTAYLEQHGADALVPLELTQPSTEPDNDDISFRQFHAPLSLFLEWMRTAEEQPQSIRLYLAQCQLSDLPQTLRGDFATPELVSQAGNGDVYDTNVWIGYPPTYTPLHRDPNPNLFVQLAGRKVVRLIGPDDGQVLFASVRRQLGRSGNREAAVFRGSEMMQGRERTLLEKEVWDEGLDTASSERKYVGYEAQLEAGDGMFIPKGWWHSIKGVGNGVTASYLALPDSSSADQTQQLDVSGDGSTVKLDHLGPLVVNQDGTLSRIANWAQMTEIEKKNTLRVLGKRNKQRMEALKATQGAQEEGN